MSLNYTKFIDACVKNDKETVKVLIEQKKHYINQTIITGDTGLHIAASRNYKDLCIMLIQYGVDLNIKNNYGKTALMKAILKGNTEIVDLLLMLNFRCGGAVYEAEKIAIKDDFYHKKCLTCNKCQRALDSLSLSTTPDGSVYCKVS